MSPITLAFSDSCSCFHMVPCLDSVHLTLCHYHFLVSFKVLKTCFEQLSQTSSRTCTSKVPCKVVSPSKGLEPFLGGRVGRKR